jgi:hypothetical protein
LLGILHKDRPRLLGIDEYHRGKQVGPYVPDNADTEYKLLASRAVSNWMPLLVDTPAQTLYIDGFRPKPGATKNESPQWRHWQRSGMDARQLAVHRGALKFGHSFTVTEKRVEGVRTRGLSALLTAAVFQDPANDIEPLAALTIVTFPTDDELGTAILWDATKRYDLTLDGVHSDANVRMTNAVAHGNSTCPVTRFAASVDLEGRTVGVIEPMKRLQDRINQTVFDLLVAQTYTSMKVRYVSGMAPPLQRDHDTGELVLDEFGNPKPVPINHNAARFLFAEDENVKFGTLDESPLEGFIASIDMSIRHLAAVSQTPPHYLLGQIANLSAEALDAAETANARKGQEFRVGFGESWERVFRIAGELDGESSADDYQGEVIWRDMEQRSIAQTADALGKLRESLEIPARGLWPRVPGVTQTEIEDWERLADEDPVATLADALSRSAPPIRDSRSGSTITRTIT